MPEADTERLPKGSKWGVCVECGYRISPERDEYEPVGDMEFAHSRCLGTEGDQQEE